MWSAKLNKQLSLDGASILILQKQRKLLNYGLNNLIKSRKTKFINQSKNERMIF